jgi:hypothetical protein
LIAEELNFANIDFLKGVWGGYMAIFMDYGKLQYGQI